MKWHVQQNASFSSGIFNELSRLLLSPLETFLNSFQNSVPFFLEEIKLMEA